MKFQYYKNDPIDDVPAPLGKVIISFVAITAFYIAYLIFWSVTLTA